MENGSNYDLNCYAAVRRECGQNETANLSQKKGTRLMMEHCKLVEHNKGSLSSMRLSRRASMQVFIVYPIMLKETCCGLFQ